MLTMLLAMKERRHFLFFAQHFFDLPRVEKGFVVEKARWRTSKLVKENLVCFLLKIMVCFDYMLFIYKNTFAKKEHGMLVWCPNQNQFPKNVIS